MIANVERRWNQSRAGVRREKFRKMTNVKIGEPDFRDLFILQQVVRTRRTLQTSTQDEHSHAVMSPENV